jgi:XRE family aerobic/anaerobic benzoate catabolism transcriptional regulator
MSKAGATKSRAREPARKAAPGLLERVGAKIRSLREAKNQSRRELALAAGLSERFLADLEAGQGNISLARFDALCFALGTSAANLLNDLGEPGNKSIKKSASNLEKAELDALLAGLDRADHREALDWLRARFGHSRGPMIALLGLRGAGKSTVGQALAKKLFVPFVELDARVEAAAGLSLAGIFSLHGEDYYRRLAREVLTRLLSELDAAVIATGGSIVTDPQALRLLTRRCRTVWLQATPEDHWRRVLAQGDERPGAASGNAQAELRALLQAREPLYSQAEVKVDTSKLGISGAVEAVVRAL